MNNSTELLNILSFDHCKTRAEIFTHVEKLATALIKNWKIVTPQGSHRFWGLEFYLIVPGIFVDKSTHKRCEQGKIGTFYFHTKSQGTWTPPIFNRHGVDITCGNEKHGIYGGILLRHLGGKGHRDGSGLALRSLVRGDQGFRPIKRGSRNRKWSKEEKNFFIRMNNKSIFGNEMYLEYDPLPKDIKITKTSRVGVDDSILENGEKLGFKVEK